MQSRGWRRALRTCAGPQHLPNPRPAVGRVRRRRAVCLCARVLSPMNEQEQGREHELVARLNPQQQEAVRHVEGPLLIIAGAGSGKTRVITHRIAYLVDVMGVRPEQILAVTFTNKAAQEMRERVRTLLDSGRRGGEPLVSTFHSLCVRILRRDVEALGEGYTRNFTIYDADDAAKLIKSCMADLHVDEKLLPVRGVYSAISGAK